MELVFMAVLSIMVILVQLVLPGMLSILSWGGRQVSFSYVDAFFCGLILNVILALLFAPFMETTQTLSFWVRVMLLLLATVTIIRIKGSLLVEEINLFIRDLFVWDSTKYSKLCIGCVTTLIFTIFVAGHNLGFDDIAHLNYIKQVFEGNVYPVYLPVVEGWEVARYPAFGLLIGALGSGIKGSGFFLYYLLGLLLLVALLVKVFDIIYGRKKNIIKALGGVAIVSCVLCIFSKDNYFNYGLYPLGSAKLLFFFGLLYLIFVWHENRSTIWLLLGGGGLTLSFLYHLNMVLVYAFILPFLIVFFYWNKKSHKNFLVNLFLIFTVTVLSFPALLSPSNGILRYEQPPVPIEKVKTEKKIKVEPSFLEKIVARAKHMALWVKEGRYKNAYIARAFSMEIFAVPLVLFLFLVLPVSSIIAVASIFVFVAVIGFETLRVVPKQFLVTCFRSSTSFFMFDLARSPGILRSKEEIFTDEYTSLILKLLGRKNVKILTQLEQCLLFYPFFSLETIKNYGMIAGNKRILVNTRYYGLATKSRLDNDYQNSFIKLSRLTEKVESNYSISRVGKVLETWAKILEEQSTAPLMLYSWISSNEMIKKRFLAPLPPLENYSDVLIWKDCSILQLGPLRLGDKIEIEADYEGGVLEPLQVITSELNAVTRIRKPFFKEKLFYLANKEVKNLLLIVQAEKGHLNGLGEIKKIAVTHRSPDENFSFHAQ